MESAQHYITLEERTKLYIKSCDEIVSFNENEIAISAYESTIVVRGTNLRVEEMSKTKSEAVIYADRIDSVTYSKGHRKSKEGIAGRIFK